MIYNSHTGQKFKGKYFGQKPPPPPRGVEKFDLLKSREEIYLVTKKKYLKTSLFLHNLVYFSLFSCRF